MTTDLRISHAIAVLRLLTDEDFADYADEYPDDPVISLTYTQIGMDVLCCPLCQQYTEVSPPDYLCERCIPLVSATLIAGRTRIQAITKLRTLITSSLTLHSQQRYLALRNICDDQGCRDVAMPIMARLLEDLLCSQ